ncbi:hypothetical protein FRC11_010020 [Ceratobasidium sp. 423]|nr:hypothetical protein FRC11_010020 [Ceratobasidium sp. 423]
MPASSTKCQCTESSHKIEACNNEQALKCKCEDKKKGTKACKAHLEEAQEDNLLIKCEGKSAKVTKLHAELECHEKQDQLQPAKMIPEPANLSIVNVKLLHTHMNLLGEEHDVEWCRYWGDACDCLNAAGLDQNKGWTKQDINQQNLVIQALENHHPNLKMFEGHWGAIFLLKECHNNLLNYQCKQNSATNTDSPSVHPNCPSDDSNDHPTANNKDNNHDHKSAAQKAALHKSEDAAKDNDGETKLEELSDEVRKAVEHKEVGIPADSLATLKPVPKPKHAHLDEEESPRKLMTSSSVKWCPIVFKKHGCGGKATSGCQAHSDVGMSSCATVDPEDDGLSSLSGQTASDGDDE